MNLAKRSFKFSGERRASDHAMRAFLAPQRERVKQPISAQAREITLAKRAVRKGRAA